MDTSVRLLLGGHVDEEEDVERILLDMFRMETLAVNLEAKALMFQYIDIFVVRVETGDLLVDLI